MPNLIYPGHIPNYKRKKGKIMKEQINLTQEGLGITPEKVEIPKDKYVITNYNDNSRAIGIATIIKRNKDGFEAELTFSEEILDVIKELPEEMVYYAPSYHILEWDDEGKIKRLRLIAVSLIYGKNPNAVLTSQKAK